MSVNREKYEKAKEAAKVWYEKLEEKKIELEEAQKNIEYYKAEAERWKHMVDQLPDTQTVEDLETENRKLSKNLRQANKQLHDSEEKYSDKIARLEREKLLAEGKIQQLEEARKDLQERYNDLKQDYREQQRWSKDKSEK
jgi:multidrug resistance efflux pump